MGTESHVCWMYNPCDLHPRVIKLVLIAPLGRHAGGERAACLISDEQAWERGANEPGAYSAGVRVLLGGDAEAARVGQRPSSAPGCYDAVINLFPIAPLRTRRDRRGFVEARPAGARPAARADLVARAEHGGGRVLTAFAIAAVRCQLAEAAGGVLHRAQRAARRSAVAHRRLEVPTRLLDRASRGAERDLTLLRFLGSTGRAPRLTARGRRGLRWGARRRGLWRRHDGTDRAWRRDLLLVRRRRPARRFDGALGRFRRLRGFLRGRSRARREQRKGDERSQTPSADHPMVVRAFRLQRKSGLTPPHASPARASQRGAHRTTSCLRPRTSTQARSTSIDSAPSRGQ
jgi:hypothetical protein